MKFLCIVIISCFGGHILALRRESVSTSSGLEVDEEPPTPQEEKLNTAKTMKQLYKQNRGKIKLARKIGKSAIGHYNEYQRSKRRSPHNPARRRTGSAANSSITNETVAEEGVSGTESRWWTSRHMTQTHTETSSEKTGDFKTDPVPDLRRKNRDYHVNIELSTN